MGPPPAAPLDKGALGACPNEKPPLKRNVTVKTAAGFLILLMRVGYSRNIIFKHRKIQIEG